jgi:high-affinity K+ transport system ATPase subunit B
VIVFVPADIFAIKILKTFRGMIQLWLAVFLNFKNFVEGYAEADTRIFAWILEQWKVLLLSHSEVDSISDSFHIEDPLTLVFRTHGIDIYYTS